MFRSYYFILLAFSWLSMGLASPSGLRVLKFEPDWFPNGQFAGFFWAEANGLYAEEGLKIEFDVFQYGKNSVAEVVAGKAAFGTMDSYIFLDKVAAGEPLIAVGAVLNTSPAGYIYLKSSGITQFSDLQGRRLGAHAYADNLARYFAKVAGLAEDAITYKRVHHDISVLLDGEVDAHQGYAIDELLRLQEITEEPVDILLFEDMGLPMYSMIIYTTKERFEQEPELIESFLRATERGYQAALEEPVAAGQIIQTLHAHDEVDENLIPAQIEAMRPFLAFEKRMGRFTMNLKRWEAMQSAFLEGDLIKEPINLSEHVYAQPED